MKTSHRVRIFAATFLALALTVAQTPARQTKTQQPAPQRPAAARAKSEAERAAAADAADVSFDDLFATDAYAVYGEMRMVGQHFASDEFRQLLEPLKLAGFAPGDLSGLFDFVEANSEQLMGARLGFGAVPAKAGLPSVVAAVELESAEEARKFAPRLREFLAKSVAPGDEGARIEAASDGPSDAQPRGRRRGRARGAARGNDATARRAAAVKEAALPFHMKLAGSVVAFSDAPFTFRKLRGGSNAPALSEEQGFAAARSRLAKETVFLYFNTTRMSAATRRQMEEFERLHEKAVEEARLAHEREVREGRADAASNSNRPPRRTVGVAVGVGDSVFVVTSPTSSNSNSAKVDRDAGPPPPAAGDEELKARLAEVEGNLAAHEKALKEGTPEDEEKRREAEARRTFENQLGDLIFSGSPFSPSRVEGGGAWPESIGVGASFEGDSVVVRAFLVSESEERPARPLPFVPVLHAGPQVTSEAANVLPADTDILVSASLDLAQMYDYVASMFKLLDLAAAAAGEPGRQGLFESQITAYEKQLKFRIREDLIKALGSEFAVAVPGEVFGVSRSRAPAKTEAKAEPGGAALTAELVNPASPVVVIALDDKRAVQALLPRALEAIGVTGVSPDQFLQKQGEAEVVTFAQGSVAFIDRFLVAAFDARTMRHVIDSYNEGRTLARSREYRDASAWQPRQQIGQAYVSSALLGEMFGDALRSTEDIDDESLRSYLRGLDPEAGAITLAATRDAGGLTHELRVPKNLLALWTASSLVSQKLAAQRANEGSAVFALYRLMSKQQKFKEAKGRYGSLEELEEVKDEFTIQMADGSHDVSGYDIKLVASGDKFEITATPTGYPKQGRRSFYIDQTGQLRGGDLGGRPASSSSEPVNY